jgi:hypothetical protein
MVFRIITDEAIIDVQREVGIGFDFDFLGIHFSHEYSRNGDESVRVQDEKGLYERVSLMSDGEPVERINNIVDLNNARIVFTSFQFDEWAWTEDQGYQIWSKCFE